MEFVPRLDSPESLPRATPNRVATSARNSASQNVTYDVSPAERLILRHQAITYPYVCQFGSARLVIDEGVFCPTLTNASALLLQLIDFKPSERVLDAFAGSGAFGINAALHGADVIAFDISPIAVACAEKNAGINRVAHRTDVRQCTVRHISPQQEAFDLVIANPPLLPGVQTGVLGPAVFDPQLAATIEFVEALGTILADGGRCFLLTSDVFDRIGYDMNRLCAESRLVNEIVAQADVGYETYRVHRIVRRKQ